MKTVGKNVPRGTWKSLDYTIEQAKQAMTKHGWKTLPSHQVLRRNGYSGLGSAIARYHGGFNNFHSLLGEEPSHVKSGTWKDLDYTIQQAKQAMGKNNWKTFPTQGILKNSGLSMLASAITIYHGGFPSFREKLGQEPLQTKPSKWQDVEYTLQQAKQAMEKNSWNTLPAQHVLMVNGYSGLSSAIKRHHGGFHSFRTLLGEEQPRVEPGLWQDLNYTLKQVKHAMGKNNWKALPGETTLEKSGYGALAAAISKYHGGLPRIRQHLGQENPQLSSGTWQSLEYCIKNAENAMKELHTKTLPDNKKLKEQGYGQLSDAITKYHGGFHNFRQILGQDQVRVKDDTWKNKEYVIMYAKRMMKALGIERLPSRKFLIENHSSFCAAIARYHGGFGKFYAYLNEEPRKTEDGSWKDLPYAINKAREALQQLGQSSLPGQWTLARKGYSGLASAITKYHGGFPAFRAILEKQMNLPSEKERLENLLRDYTDEDSLDGGLDDEEGYAPVPA